MPALFFENSFYQARQKGLVSAEQITEMMVAAQKRKLRRWIS